MWFCYYGKSATQLETVCITPGLLDALPSLGGKGMFNLIEENPLFLLSLLHLSRDLIFLSCRHVYINDWFVQKMKKKNASNDYFRMYLVNAKWITHFLSLECCSVSSVFWVYCRPFSSQIKLFPRQLRTITYISYVSSFLLGRRSI